MKKTLLAAALLAGFASAGVAQAETSVTLYGILDTGYGYNQVKYNENGYDYRATNSGMTSGVINGNRFGLRGSEDLGNGLRAVFTLEQGFNLGNGEQSSTKAFHRQAWVGLASDDFGTFTMGRQYNMGALMVYDTFNMGSAGGDMDNAFGGIGYGNRMDNSFRYVTPSIAGFQAGVAYANKKTSINRDTGTSTVNGLNDDRTNWTSVGLKYANGPIAFGASYDRQDNKDQADPLTSWNVGASYDFEVVKLALAYGQDRHGKMAGGSTTTSGPLSAANIANGKVAGFTDYNSNDFKSKNFYVGLSAPIASGTLVAGWTRSDSNLEDISATFDEAAQNLYSLKYQYPLSKRTSVYAYGTYGTGYAYLDGAKAKEAGIGLNHKF